ncbi:MAG: hypothetical protein KDJ28_07470 [Candidatus Competibacteraceae bacterium]|nr:hypothetical protein [Candidatus Competibacteraceae bacterium]
MLLLISLGGISLRAQGAEIEIMPPTPSVNDRISIRIFDEWPDACTPENPEVMVSANTIEINTFSDSQACSQVITPWELQISVGYLPAGDYQVRVLYTREATLPSATSQIGQTRFTVTNAAHEGAFLESPQQDSYESGIGLIRGWVCQAETIEVQIDDGSRRVVAYGTTRGDTREVCGDDDNGFGYTFNWNALGDGTHRLQAFADGVVFADVRFTVTTLGVDFLRDASGEYELENFPQLGECVTVRWSESHQNFVISGQRLCLPGITLQ